MLCLRNALKLLQPVAESLSFLAHVQLKTNHKPHRPSGCPDRNLPGLLPHWSWQSSLHPWLHENRHGFQRKWWKYSIVWRKLRNLSTGEEEELATQLTLDLLTHHSFYSSSLSSYIATLPVSPARSWLWGGNATLKRSERGRCEDATAWSTGSHDSASTDRSLWKPVRFYTDLWEPLCFPTVPLETIHPSFLFFVSDNLYFFSRIICSASLYETPVSLHLSLETCFCICPQTSLFSIHASFPNTTLPLQLATPSWVPNVALAVIHANLTHLITQPSTLSFNDSQEPSKLVLQPGFFWKTVDFLRRKLHSMQITPLDLSLLHGGKKGQAKADCAKIPTSSPNITASYHHIEHHYGRNANLHI